MDLAAILARLLDEHDVPGAAVGVIDGDGARIVTAGVRGGGRGSVDDDTVFAAASLTKPVFATGVVALADAGGIDLDRPLSDHAGEPYLPDDERATSITARMVLSHTTGFPNWREDGPLFLRWAPGTRWGYSGEGYAYLQQVLEHVTGTSLERHLAATVFEPLGMDHSGFVRRDEEAAGFAFGHDRGGRPQPPFRTRGWKAAAGGLYTTAPDYLRFLIHSLAHAGRLFDPQVRIDDELAWGLGWGIEDTRDRAVWQWGNDPGWKNFVIGRPRDGQGVVVFTNGDNGPLVYRDVVSRILPGPHPSLDTRRRRSWLLATAPRPVDLQLRLDEPAVQAVLEGLTTPGERTRLLGLVVERSWERQDLTPGTPVAGLALELRRPGEAEITSLAVLPEWRRQGFARALLVGAAAQLDLRVLEAETGADAVGFFRAVGCSVEDLGGDRFRCRLDLPPP